MTKVMVTGASSGLGAEIAKNFAGRGCELVVVARRQSLLEELRVDLLEAGAASAEYRVVDLSNSEQVEALTSEFSTLGIDVLINNAAIGHWNYTWDTTPETMQAMIAVNVSAVAILTAAFSQLRHEQQSARLMNIASGAGYALFGGAIPYSATKFFVTSMTEGLALELASKNLPMRAQLLAPGPIQTEFLVNSLKESKMVFGEEDMAGVKYHTAKEVADYAMQLFDSNLLVGAVQPDMSFVMSDGLHPVGQLAG